MRTLKRVAAILCSATILSVIGCAAFVANAQETIPLKDRESEFDTDVVNIVSDKVYAEPGEKVEYSVYLVGNEGYSGSGIVLNYDERLTPAIKAGTTDTPDAKGGPAVQDLLPSYSLNTTIYTFAASTAGSMGAVSTNDGVYVTTWFTVPSDAKNGDLFPIKLTVSRWLDNKNDPISYYPISGWIQVKTEDSTTTTTSTTETTTSTTESTTTTTESTTTTTETTSSTTESTSTTTESTTTSTETTSSTTQTTTSTTETTSTTTDTSTGSTSSTTESSTTSSTETTETTSKTTETTSSTDTTSQTTDTGSTAKPITDTTSHGTTEKTTDHTTEATTPDDKIPSTTKADGIKTGDTGVAVAVACLGLAAGAAVVTGMKRKEQ